MYVNYTDEDYVPRLALLRPQLLIISLGTNESFGRRFSETEFHNQVKRFLAMIRREMPQVEIILTTPPECYRRTYVNKKRVFVRNDNTERHCPAGKIGQKFFIPIELMSNLRRLKNFTIYVTE